MLSYSKDVEWVPACIPGFGGNATPCPQDASLAIYLWMNLLCVRMTSCLEASER